MKANGQNGLQISQKLSKLLYSSAQSKPSDLMSLRREEVVLRRDRLVGDGRREVEAGGRRRPQPLHRAEVVELQGRRRLRRRVRVRLHHCAEEKKGRMASLMILSTYICSTSHYSPIMTTPWMVTYSLNKWLGFRNGGKSPLSELLLSGIIFHHRFHSLFLMVRFHCKKWWLSGLTYNTSK